jgi:hypothetical protein
MQYARVFLSHASPDKPLVQAVADALARRGVVAWLDIHDLHPGLDLTRALAQAIREHTLVVAFLSEDSLRSPWVDDELAVALDQEQATRDSTQPAVVVPVFLGEPLHLVQGHERVRTRWMHADGDRVDRLGIAALGWNTTGTLVPRSASEIAGQIAQSLYERLGTAGARDVAIILDQRGDGTRTGLPSFVPHNIEALDIPALVFRPDLGPRSHGEVLQGREWEQFSGDMNGALQQALGSRRPTPRKVRILGASQLAIPFVLGQRLNRTHGATLYGYDRKGAALSLELGLQEVPLTGGSPDCARADPRLAPLPFVSAATESGELVLLLMTDNDAYLRKAKQFLQTRGHTPPVSWIRHPHQIASADEIVSLARDIKALVDHVGARAVEILTTLPFHAVPLLAALLTPHVLGRVTFLEYDRSSEQYVPLQLPPL